MNINLNKHTTVIVKDADGKQICRIELGAASLTKTGKGGPQILELFQLKPKTIKATEAMDKK